MTFWERYHENIAAYYEFARSIPQRKIELELVNEIVDRLNGWKQTFTSMKEETKKLKHPTQAEAKLNQTISKIDTLLERMHARRDKIGTDIEKVERASQRPEAGPRRPSFRVLEHPDPWD